MVIKVTLIRLAEIAFFLTAALLITDDKAANIMLGIMVANVGELLGFLVYEKIIKKA